jgi:glycosyltransferase involved in cell wall biosynthesis
MLNHSNTSILISSLGGGGAERQCVYLSENLAITNLLLLENIVAYPTNKELVKVLYKEKTSRLKQILTAPFLISKYLKAGDTLVSFMEVSNLINILFKLIFKKHKCIVSCRISPSYYLGLRFGTVMRFLMRLLYPYADLITANSLDSLDELKQLIDLPADKFLYIPNAIDVEKIAQIPKHPNLPKKYFVTVGRLSEQKNIDLIIRTIAQLKKSNVHYPLLVVGDGPLKNKLIDLAQTLGLKTEINIEITGADIYFLGFQNNPYQYVSENSIFLLSSKYEGMPNVIIEAMARGATIISSNCKTGPRELLSPDESFNSQKQIYEYGVLMPEANDTIQEAVNWSEILTNFINDEKLLKHYSKKSRERAQSFTLNHVMQLWQRAINQK